MNHRFLAEPVSGRIVNNLGGFVECLKVAEPCLTFDGEVGRYRSVLVGQKPTHYAVRPSATSTAAFKVQRPFARVRLTGTLSAKPAVHAVAITAIPQ